MTLSQTPISPLHTTSRKKILFVSGVVILAAVIGMVGRFTFTLERITAGNNLTLQLYDDEEGFSPHKDPDRLNVLGLGIRGIGDPEGGLLTDAMVVISMQKSTRSTALISIPRDLWVRMPGRREYDKINAAYALGFEEGGSRLALAYASAIAEKVTGLKLDGAFSVNLDGVREFIDAIGGIAITRRTPFIEDQQWVFGGDMGSSSAFVIRRTTVTTTVEKIVENVTTTEEVATQAEKWVFQIPAGTQTLDGATALYYMRARFSSSDFDRASREQEVLLAVRNKVKSLGILLNPFKIHDLLRAFEKHVATNITPSEIAEFASLASQLETNRIHRVVLAAGGESALLEAKRQNGAYVLVPKSGDYREIRVACKDVFREYGE